ncbi:MULTISPECIES: amino acid permease [Nguyenibacter]|uniref:Amino acid permease n=1 Tax=Nguyenibacter vanlangensis TaxID=1216886 RepID=A0A7Y7IW07_9PROT|nr:MULTISPECIES: amino acid permease [Nguyenibacter]NVN11388.1 amino acid permease [Nguyenibacter vanlangensis]WRH87943.1 amino acid permease [Nguyenibacter sp. L1]
MAQPPANQTATGLFRRKRIEIPNDSHGLRRVLGPASLIALGIGCTIGAGLFSLTGIAASENAGPAVVLSYIVAAIACGFAGLCYSELASMIPIAGSAYTYAYMALGEIVAWIIGWDLVLEYAVGAAAVSVSWSRYVASLLGTWGISLPPRLLASPFEAVTLPDGSHVTGFMNLPAAFIICVVSALLIRGVSESARVNSVIVVVKLAIIAAVIAFGLPYIKTANYVPFIPANTGTFGHFGLSGIMRAAGTIFFAYVGFDAVSTAAQETRNPARDMPIGILGSLLICTLAYVAFSLVLTGLVNYHDMLGDAAPVATAIDRTPFPWLKLAVKIGIICGFTSVLLVLLLGQSRVFYAMSRDRLLPAMFSSIHPQWRTPWYSNLLFMVITGGLAAFLPIDQLAHMTSIGTLLAFVIVCVGVMFLRRTAPGLERRFRVPGGPVIPVLGILCCLAVMLSLDGLTWIRLAVWLIIGMAIYFGYSRRNSALASES